LGFRVEKRPPYRAAFLGEWAPLWSKLPEFGTNGELHLKRRAFAQRRLHPDAPTVHLDDLLGDSEAKARATLGLGNRAIDLVELIENPILLIEGYAWTCICDRNGKVAIPRARGDAHLAGVGELDGVANEIEQHLREALFVSEANWERLVHGRRERELLVLGERLGGGTYRLDHTLDRILAHVEGELSGLDLGDVQHGIDEA